MRKILPILLPIVALFFIWAGFSAAIRIADSRLVVIKEYYVSSSQGNDNNSGISSKPWKTLAKVSAQKFEPGTVIYLKRGDIWNEAFIPQGSGNFAKNQWIIVKPYGAHNLSKPVIDRKNASGVNKDFAIKLVDNQAWRFENIIIRNSKTGFVYLGSEETKQKNGLQIVGLEFENIRGLPDHKKKPEEDKRPYWWIRGSTAISITGYGYCKDGLPATNENCVGDKNNSLGSYGPGLSNVLIEDIKINNSTYGIWIWAGGFSGGYGKNYKIVNPHVIKSGIGGIEVSFAENVFIKNAKVQYAGGDSCWSGTFGKDINYTKNLIIQGGDVSHTLGKVFYEGEGTGINMNGPNENLKITSVSIHHNDGPAIAIQAGSPNDKSTYDFSNNKIYDNARKNDDPAPGQYEYAEFITALHLGQIKAKVCSNLIKVKTNRHLITAVWIKEPFDPNVWKDTFDDNDYRLPGWTFCGNRDISRGEKNPPLIRGNKACK